MVQTLGLDNVDVYTGRIEDLAREEPASFAAVTARALAQLSILMEFASPLLQEGGRLICYKANVSDEEMEHALSLQNRLAMKLYPIVSLSLARITAASFASKKRVPRM